MALPSQMEQTGSAGRGHVYGRRGKNGKPIAVALGILVVAGVAAGMWALKKSPSGGPETASGAPGTKSSLEAGSKDGSKDAGKSATPGPVSLGPKSNPSPAKPNDKPAVKEPGAGEKPFALQQSGDKAGGAKSDPPGPLSRAVEKGGASIPSTAPGAEPRTQPDNPKPAPVDLSRPDGKPVTPEAAPAKPADPGTPIAASGSTMEVRQTIEAGDKKLGGGELVQARVLYSKALADKNASKEDQERLRGKLAQINQDLLFSSKVAAGDPLVETYTVQAGDSLVKIARKRDLTVDWRLIQRVNAMSSPDVLRQGQKIKLVRGPFHAVVHKSEYRVDVYSGAPDDPSSWIYIRSFRCGLGANDKTPIGEFVVKPKSKLVNPPWTNPQTGEKFGADDPKNPIGEYWIGIEGVGDSKKYTGFGLHGTIEPDSIGQQKSMGCVRMGGDDISLVYELLKESVSVVKIEA